MQYRKAMECYYSKSNHNKRGCFEKLAIQNLWVKRSKEFQVIKEWVPREIRAVTTFYKYPRVVHSLFSNILYRISRLLLLQRLKVGCLAEWRAKHLGDIIFLSLSRNKHFVVWLREARMLWEKKRVYTCRRALASTGAFVSEIVIFSMKETF